MPRSKPTQSRARKSAKAKKVVRMLSPLQVSAAVETMAAPSGTARFAAGKALSVTAERDPGRVYPQFSAIAALLRSDSKIVRWNAMQILSRLSPVDEAHELDPVVEVCLAFIGEGNLVTACNAIQGLGRIARFRPDLVDRIVPGLLAVEGATYETAECRNVAIDNVLKALEPMWSSVRIRSDVAEFMRRQLTNPRPSVARRAAKMTTA